MTITLNLSAAVEARLEDRAARAGTTVAALLERAAAELADLKEEHDIRPGAELGLQLEAEGLLGSTNGQANEPGLSSRNGNAVASHAAE